MSDRDPLAPLLRVLKDLVAWVDSEQTPAMIIGGVAASILGRPRATRDVDVLVLLDEKKWEAFLQAGISFGFKARRKDCVDFAKKTHVLLVRHEPSGIDADIAIGTLLFEKEAITRSDRIEVGDTRIPVPTPEDLLIMKAVANRPRDLFDIEAILSTHPELDLRRVRRWVREFSTALQMPQIQRDFEVLLAKRRKKKR